MGTSLFELEKLKQKRDKAHEEYISAKNNLENAEIPIIEAARIANEKWLEFKSADRDWNNYQISFTLGELYHC